MPRVTVKTKNKGGKHAYRCEHCGKAIEAGQKYYKWSFRYGGTHRQHTTCGAPKQSQLTQSKMSAVYSAQETAHASVTQAASVGDLVAALNDCATEIESVRDEYQGGLDNMPDGLRSAAEEGETGQRIEALSEFIDELQSKASDIESEEFECEEDEEDKEQKRDEWWSDLVSQADEAIDNLNE